MVSKYERLLRKLNRNRYDMVEELKRAFLPETNQEQQRHQRQQHFGEIPVNTDARARLALPTDPSVGNKIAGIRSNNAISSAAQQLRSNKSNIVERALEQTNSTMDTSPSTTTDDPFATFHRTVATAPLLDQLTILTMETAPSTNTIDDPFATLIKTVPTAPSLNELRDGRGASNFNFQR